MKPATGLALLILLLAGLLGLPAWSTEGSVDLQCWTLYMNVLYLSGYMAVGLMSLAMLLAMRWPSLNRRLGGLDRAYQVHRQLALWGTGLGLFHYLLRQLVKELRHAGLMSKPQDAPSWALELLRPLHGSAKDLAEWGLYLAIALVLLALWRRLPYRWFALAHRLMPLAFLAVAYHSVVFLPKGYWGGWGLLGSGLLMVLMLLGGLAAIMSLVGRVGRSRRHAGEVIEVRSLPLDVLEIRLRLAPGWPGHESGQFGLLTLDTREGAHPFTIASSWKGDGELRFAIKALGDYTRRLPELVAPGDRAWVEGPYGRFVFADAKPRQIWVGGGIGMTPFVARLQELAQARSADPTQLQTQQLELFYCTRRGDPEITHALHELAQAAGVRLHVLETATQGQLSAQRLMDLAPHWREASIWFCGPARFGQALREGLSAQGLHAADFHQEAFEFR